MLELPGSCRRRRRRCRSPLLHPPLSAGGDRRPRLCGGGMPPGQVGEEASPQRNRHLNLHAQLQTARRLPGEPALPRRGGKSRVAAIMSARAPIRLFGAFPTPCLMPFPTTVRGFRSHVRVVLAVPELSTSPPLPVGALSDAFSDALPDARRVCQHASPW